MPVDIDRAGHMSNVIEQHILVALRRSDGGEVQYAAAQSVLTKTLGFAYPLLILGFYELNSGRIGTGRPELKFLEPDSSSVISPVSKAKRQTVRGAGPHPHTKTSSGTGSTAISC